MGALDESEAVSRLSRDPASTGLFTDFDGTLSPIVSDPESAQPLPGACEALSWLARGFAKVVVVSGRPAWWLADRLGRDQTSRLELFGLHGLEHWSGSAGEPVASARQFVGSVAAARDWALSRAVPGLVVEDKVFSLTLHWRGAADRQLTGRAAMALGTELAGSTGLLLRPGKASVELVPPLGIDKGTVVREQGRGLGQLAFLGDDFGDVAGFDALDDLAEQGAEVIRIAVASPEAPSELLQRADLVLSGPQSAVQLLQALVGG
ncbi:MAG: trehalose-phosphatase [Acidimicrobiales bacterium]